jgi:hypothetical protein
VGSGVTSGAKKTAGLGAADRFARGVGEGAGQARSGAKEELIPDKAIMRTEHATGSAAL